MKRNLFPKVTIYSSKLLFDQNDDRIKKRMAQMLKRKKVISEHKNSKIEKTKENISEEIISPSTQDYTIQNNIKISFDNSNDINETINSQLYDKEVNLSDISDLHDSNKNLAEDKNSYAYKNKFALAYLSSHLNSFINFKNRLKSKINYENNYYTESYSLALFNNLETESTLNKYKVNEIIIEEKESNTPKKIPIKNNTKKNYNKNKKIISLNNFMNNCNINNFGNNSQILPNSKKINTANIKPLTKNHAYANNNRNEYKNNLKKLFIKIPLLKLLKLDEYPISKYIPQYKIFSSKANSNSHCSQILNSLNNSHSHTYTKRQTNNKNIFMFNKNEKVMYQKKSVADYLVLLKNKYNNKKNSKLVFSLKQLLK